MLQNIRTLLTSILCTTGLYMASFQLMQLMIAYPAIFVALSNFQNPQSCPFLL